MNIKKNSHPFAEVAQAILTIFNNDSNFLKIAENVGKEYKNMDHDLSILENEIQFTDNIYEKLGHGKKGYLGIDNSQASRLNGYLDEKWYYVDKKGHIKKTQQ